MPQHPVPSRLAKGPRRIGWRDVALVANRSQGVTGPLNLVERAYGLWRVALKLQFDYNHSLREAAQRLLHAFRDQCLRAFGIDLHQVATRPIGAQPVRSSVAVGTGIAFALCECAQRSRNDTAWSPWCTNEIHALPVATTDDLLADLRLLATAVER